jgi:ABC-type antimicrobial peptide transport system permease subunit
LRERRDALARARQLAQKEISVRLAIGASRSRLIRQLLTESVLMPALGGLLGLVFANWGTQARLTTIFGLLALLLAMIGLYGTIAYAVTRKTHGIGIRMALGAKPTNVLGMVLRQGITLTLIGVAFGVVATLGVTRLISSMIFGVSPYDPLTFVAVAACQRGAK